jgi:hypothetical protein
VKISQLTEQLEKIQFEKGDLEVTCTGALLEDGFSITGGPIPDVFETTVENLKVINSEDGTECRVRLYL